MSDNKPGAILTQRQLDYLDPTDDHSPKNEREYNKRIRERIEYGLLDLNLLFKYLDEDELRKVFGTRYAEPLEAQEEAAGELPTASPTPTYVPGAIAFMLWGLNFDDKPLYPPFESEQPAFTEFKRAVEKGIRQYLREKKGLQANVNVEIELSDVRRTEDLMDEPEG